MPRKNATRSNPVPDVGATGDHTIADLRAAEAEVAHLEEERDRLRSDVIGAMWPGFDGPGPQASTARPRWRPLVAVCLFGALPELPRGIALAFAVEIAGMLGASRGSAGDPGLIGALALGCGALGGVAALNRRVRRIHIALAASGAGALLLLFLATTTSSGGFALGIAGSAVVGGAGAAVHRPLLVDLYPVRHRGLVLAWYRGVRLLAFAGSFAVAAVCAEAFELTWRAAFAVVAAIGVAIVATGAKVRDPGHGSSDRSAFEQAVDDTDLCEGMTTASTTDRVPAVLESVRRLMATPHVRTFLHGYVLAGVLLVAVPVYLYSYLEEEWGSSVAERTWFSALVLVLAAAMFAAAVAAAGPRRNLNPRDVPRVIGWSLVAGSGSIALGVTSSSFALMTLLVAAGMASALVAVTALDLGTMTVVDPVSRPHASALSEIAAIAAGGLIGSMLLGALERRLGYTVALASVVAVGAAGLALFRRATDRFPVAVGSVADAIIEGAEVALARKRQRHLPLLSCRHVDFAYGKLQVLFDVSFTVDEGEMVALLGTNGAGKSTLLRTISGLAIPTRGSVRFEGYDITHMGAEERVRAGIVQIPGGRSVFGRMPVHENLRIQAYTMGGGRAAVERAMEDAFAAFPALATRRDQLASTLSGGEQQMLALGKALMLRPRLLLIDELSLGLAPVVVAELIDIVRLIRERGTAVVLVEQSVNVALSLADHAYFMEKGQIAFDGPAPELLRRDDLLRSVFLKGAASGIGGLSAPERATAAAGPARRSGSGSGRGA